MPRESLHLFAVRRLLQQSIDLLLHFLDRHHQPTRPDLRSVALQPLLRSRGTSPQITLVLVFALR